MVSKMFRREKEGSTYRSREPSSQFKSQKSSEILECLLQPKVDLNVLRNLCLSQGGLLTSDLRSKAWHKLLNITLYDVDTCDGDDNHNDGNVPSGSRPVNTDAIIDLDSNRAVYFRYQELKSSTEESDSGAYREECTSQLRNIIKSTMARLDNGLHYYQGFHDVASVVYANMPGEESKASAVLYRIANKHLQDAMHENFDSISSFLNLSFFPLLQKLDLELHDYLKRAELQPTVFLKWIITLFSHDIHDPNIASRLFDSILASHPLFPIYLSMAVLIINRQELFELEYEDPAMLEVIASRLVSNIVNDLDEKEGGFTAQSMIDMAVNFMHDVPPEIIMHIAGGSKQESDLNISLTKINNKVDTVFSDWLQLKMANPRKKPSSMNLRATHRPTDFLVSDSFLLNESFDFCSGNKTFGISHVPSLATSDSSSSDEDECII